MKISLPPAGGTPLRSRLMVGRRKKKKKSPDSPDFRGGQSGTGLCSVVCTSLPVSLEGFGCERSSESRNQEANCRVFSLSRFPAGVCFVLVFFFHFKPGSVDSLLPLPKRAALVYDPVGSLTIIANRWIHFTTFCTLASVRLIISASESLLREDMI